MMLDYPLRTVAQSIAIVDWLAKNRMNWVHPCPNAMGEPKEWFNRRDKVVPEIEKRGLHVIFGGHTMHTWLSPDYFKEHPDWFSREADGSLASPYAVDPSDTRKRKVWADLAEIKTRGTLRIIGTVDDPPEMFNSSAIGEPGFSRELAEAAESSAFWVKITPTVEGPHRLEVWLKDLNGSRSAKTGFAATGQGTNDYWNLYRHYDPKFVPGTALVANGLMENLKLADGADRIILAEIVVQ